MLFISYVFFAFLLFYLGIELVLTLIGLMIFQSLSNYETGAYQLDKKATTSFSSKRKAYKEITVFFLRVLLRSVAKRLFSMFKYFAPIPIIFYLNTQVKIQEPFFYAKTDGTAVKFSENLAKTYDFTKTKNQFSNYQRRIIFSWGDKQWENACLLNTRSAYFINAAAVSGNDIL